MAYVDHYKLADDVINHINGFISNLNDPFLVSRYIGFVTVAAATVYELAIKEIIIDFGNKKHKVLGNFTESYFKRINGRIKLKTIKQDYVVRFGEKYLIRFNRKLNDLENRILVQRRISVINSYNNLIEWRNQFAHQGQCPATVTFNEVVDSYNVGKEVIKCLYDSMRY